VTNTTKLLCFNVFVWNVWNVCWYNSYPG
jgi:hypothetical protein